MNDTLLALLSLAAGALISLFISRLYYRRGGFAWYAKEFEVFDHSAYSAGGRIKLTADDQPIDQINTALVVFWNSGSVAHSRASLAPADPLRFVVNPLPFKHLGKIESSRPAVSPELVKIENGYSVQFDVMDEGDWFLAYILYEVDPDNKIRPEVRGSLINVPGGLKYVDLEDYFTEKMWKRRFAALWVGAMPIIVAYLAYEMISLVQELERASGVSAPGLSVATWAAYCVVGLLTLGSIAYTASRWSTISTKVPKALLGALPMKQTHWFSK